MKIILWIPYDIEVQKWQNKYMLSQLLFINQGLKSVPFGCKNGIKWLKNERKYIIKVPYLKN